MTDTYKGTLDQAVVASALGPTAKPGLVHRVVEIMRLERSICAEIAARYGGKNSEEIAEQIGLRNSKKIPEVEDQE